MSNTSSIASNAFADGYGRWHAQIPKDSPNPYAAAQVVIWNEVQTREAPRAVPMPTVARAEHYDTPDSIAFIEAEWPHTDPLTEPVREVPAGLPAGAVRAEGAATQYADALAILDEYDALSSRYFALVQRDLHDDLEARGGVLSALEDYLPDDLTADDVFADVFLRHGENLNVTPTEWDAAHYWQATQDHITNLLTGQGHDPNEYEQARMAVTPDGEQ